MYKVQVSVTMLIFPGHFFPGPSKALMNTSDCSSTCCPGPQKRSLFVQKKHQTSDAATNSAAVYSEALCDKEKSRLQTSKEPADCCAMSILGMGGGGGADGGSDLGSSFVSVHLGPVKICFCSFHSLLFSPCPKVHPRRVLWEV